MCGTVRDALTGVWLGVKQGSEDEAAFFKVIVSTGEVHERDKMLYFETIDNYVRFFGTRPSQMAVQSFTERRDEWSRKRKQQEREQQQQQVV